MLRGGYGVGDVSSELKKKNFASVVYGCKGTACGGDGRYTILQECCTISMLGMFLGTKFSKGVLSYGGEVFKTSRSTVTIRNKPTCSNLF